MKKLLLIGFIILGITSISAQEKGKIRAGLDLGGYFNDDGGVLLSLEVKYNLTDNSNVGMRFGAKSDPLGGDAANYISATYDYYFHNNNSSRAPFIGAGLGGYSGVYDDKFNFTGMIRGGVELRKFRISLEYNLIPDTELIIGDFSIVYKNSYFGASIGFYVGGGKWKSKN